MKYTQLMVHFLVKLFKVLGQKLQKKLMNELENIWSHLFTLFSDLSVFTDADLFVGSGIGESDTLDLGAGVSSRTRPTTKTWGCVYAAHTHVTRHDSTLYRQRKLCLWLCKDKKCPELHTQLFPVLTIHCICSKWQVYETQHSTVEPTKNQHLSL